MILADHNGHLTQINSGISVPTDPVLMSGSACTNEPGGQTPTVKWSGDCQVHLQNTVTEMVRGTGANQALIFKEATLVTVPSNIKDSNGVPIEIEADDVLTIVKISSLGQPAGTRQYQVKIRDETQWPMGKFRYTCLSV